MATFPSEAMELPDLRHGTLTYSLLAGLKAVEGDPLKDRWIRPSREDQVAHVLEWYGYASAHVPRLTEDLLCRPQDVQHSAAGTNFPVLPVLGSGEAVRPRVLAAENVSEPVVPSVESWTPRVAGASAGREEAEDVEAARAARISADSSLYLVVVGINSYTESTMNLEYATSDAKAIAELFRSRGPKLYREVHVEELIDGEAYLEAGKTVRLAVRTPGTLDPAEQFQQLHHPGLPADVAHGERPIPKSD